MLNDFYKNIVLKYPNRVLLLVFVVIALLANQATKLEIDASAETLLLQDDKELEFLRDIEKRYVTDDFLILAFTPKQDLLSDKTLKNIKSLTKELSRLDSVKSISSILTVPLMQSPPIPIKELLENIPTIESYGIDFKLAKKEFLNSPIYKNNLISNDFKTTALLITLDEDSKLKELVNRRNSAKGEELSAIELELKSHRDKARESNHQNIAKIRAVMKSHAGDGKLFLGGVDMIADDMISFIRYDLKTYGTVVLLLLIVVLWVIFRGVRWIVIPVLIALSSVIASAGIFGMLGFEVTVISSNFISLQLIITMSLIIHLIVRYRELLDKKPNATQKELVLESIMDMSKPCLFAVLTTVAGFISLTLADLLPVINLGWMMSASVFLSLIVTFLIFPTILVQLKIRPMPSALSKSGFSFTRPLASFVKKHALLVDLAGLVAILFSLSGASQLIVENSFIDYFKKDTEIYKGMKVIDKKLGGTTPLDVLINFPKEAPVEPSEKDEFDDFEEEFSSSKDAEHYWFTVDRMKKIENIHDYLQNLPEVGKVLSLGTMSKIGRTLNGGEDLDNFKLALIYKELPAEIRKVILDPYVDVENSQTRFSVRVIDSSKNLRRNEFLNKIRIDLHEKFGLENSQIHLTNLLVLYNNILQSLFSSQIVTLGTVLIILTIMFFILFRSIKITVIAMASNIVPVGVVFGFMGWANIPLDMMTITIAAIGVGIAVDNSIHYIIRFKLEYAKTKDYIESMYNSHQSIGYAMSYTSIAIMIGFSILVFSNFVPTIYFGLLTVLVMFISLASNLLLLPRLITLIKPFN